MNKLQSLLMEFRDQVPEFIATDVVDVASGVSIGGLTSDPSFDASAAAASFGELLKASATALERLGKNPRATEDVLISTHDYFVLLRLLPEHYFHCVAVSRRGNLGLARVIMKRFEPRLSSLLAAAPPAAE